MANRKKKAAERLSKVLLVRVTTQERKQLEREAKAAAVKLSEWMRRKLLGFVTLSDQS
jgi:hypothetical protein